MQQKACRLLAPFPRDHKYAVACFSAEYGLQRSLPFQAGGLGFLAGDYIKECSDLCLPLVAVGCMYPEGYLRQQIRSNGWQENFVESINREAAPMYYKMSESSIPHQWVRLMKESIKSIAAGFSARRMVKQYIEKFYSKSMEAALKD